MTDQPGLPPLGATFGPAETNFAVWAPSVESVELVLGDTGERQVPMRRNGEYLETAVQGVAPGTRYGFSVNGGQVFPDPCSRSQPNGVHGLSELIDPAAFQWENDSFTPPAAEDFVIYELHPGTFAADGRGPGTFESAIAKLPQLVDLGINAIEVMPVAAFPGRWNWGYDGVALFAPFEGYGGPEGFRRFVDAAHGQGLAVLMDVVYNHLGPDGNYTGVYSDRYFTASHDTPWGAAVNFDDTGSKHVRHFVVQNVLHWFREYHIDGLRFDAVHAIRDDSPRHILAEIREAAAGALPGGRSPYLSVESDENDPRYIREESGGGLGMDAVWSDDFHHSLHVRLTGEHGGYYHSFDGSTEEMARIIQHGFRQVGRDGAAGTAHWRESEAVPAEPFPRYILCLQNHDQVGNRPFGDRLTQAADRRDYLATSMLVLLLPQTPLLFQGQDFHASAPFRYFTDHNEELGRLVTEGRRREFWQDSTVIDESMAARIPDPQADGTFLASLLPWDEAESGPGSLCRDFYRELLALRAADPVLRDVRRGSGTLAAVPSEDALVVAFESPAGRRLLAVNFGAETIEFVATDYSQLVVSSAEARWWAVALEQASLDDGTFHLPGRTAAFLSA